MLSCMTWLNVITPLYSRERRHINASLSNEMQLIFGIKHGSYLTCCNTCTQKVGSRSAIFKGKFGGRLQGRTSLPESRYIQNKTSCHHKPCYLCSSLLSREVSMALLSFSKNLHRADWKGTGLGAQVPAESSESSLITIDSPNPPFHI